MSASCILRQTLFSRRFAGGFSNSLLCVSRSKPLGQPLASKPLISRTWSTKAFLNVKDVSKLSLAEDQRVKGFGILQFAQSKYRRATHQDHRVPRYSAGGPGGRPKVSWIESIPPPFIFWGILAINVGVFIAWYSAESTYKVMRDSKPYIWMQQNFTTSMDNVKSGRIWTVLTCCFSQNGTTHLLFNGFTYFFMAQPVLAMLGNKQFLILYLGGGMISSLTSLLWNQSTPHYASHGASGAIYAIMSYFACRQPFAKFMLFAIVPIPAWVFVPGVLLYDGYEMMSSHSTSRTDTAGHVGGILGGAAYFLSRRAGIRL